jgi:hypothetical protein
MTRLVRMKTAWVALGFLVLTGCGGGGSTTKRVGMSGDVTYDGKPVEDGTITFTYMGDVSGSATAEGPIKNGHYRLQAVVPGKNTVKVSTAKRQQQISSSSYADMMKKSLEKSKVRMSESRKMSPEEAAKMAGYGDAGDSGQVPPDADGNNATIEVPAAGGTQDISLGKPVKKK